MKRFMELLGVGMLFTASVLALGLAASFPGENIAGEDAAGTGGAGPELVLKETPFGNTDGAILSSFVVSPDSRRLAYYKPAGENQIVLILDGTPTVPCRNINTGSPVFSPDSQHLARVVFEAEKWFVAVDGVAGKQFSRILVGSLVWSADSKRYSYAARVDDTKWLVVVNDAPQKPYDEITPPVFSMDSNRVAYLAKADGKWRLVLDGVEGEKQYETIGSKPFFSPDSKHVAFVGIRDAKYSLVVDGAEGKAYNAIKSPIFSPDSQRIAYYARTEGGTSVVVLDGKEEKPHDEVGGITFSPDSKRLAYWGRTDGDKPANVMVVDGVEEKPHESTGTPIFSPDSKHVMYSVQDGKKYRVVLDGTEGPQYDQVAETTMRFSPDSQRTAHIAQSGDKWVAVVDGQAGPPCDDISTPTISPDSAHVAYAAGKRSDSTVRIVFDGVEQKAYFRTAEGTLTFSPDSKHIAYAAQKADRKYAIVVDGVEAGDYTNYRIGYNVVKFDSPSSCHFIMMKGKEMFLVDVEIKE
jgi:Tol biopolymer transport system component